MTTGMQQGVFEGMILIIKKGTLYNLYRECILKSFFRFRNKRNRTGIVSISLLSSVTKIILLVGLLDKNIMKISTLKKLQIFSKRDEDGAKYKYQTMLVSILGIDFVYFQRGV